MTPNRPRGEVALTIDGVPRRLRLTLGALAELEGALGAGSLIALAERFEEGTVSAGDLLHLLAAGLRGAGEPVSHEALAEAEIAGGAVGALKAGLALLKAAFEPVP